MLTKGWEELVTVTRGFILEKKGDLAGAKKAYADRPSEDGEARLALLAFRAGNTADLARQLSNPASPTKKIVLGLLARAENRPADAKEWFHKAWLQTHDPAEMSKNHVFMPIYYCEPVPD